MKYCGIDLHSNNSVVSIIDEADHVVAKRRLPNEPVKIVTFLAGWKEELAGIVVESIYSWDWLVDVLQAEDFTVHPAHTTAIKKYEGLKHNGDESDARYLAHLLRLGIPPTGTILPAEARNLRDLARKRIQLVRSRTTHILAIENITARQFGRRITSNQVGRLDEAPVSQPPCRNTLVNLTMAFLGLARLPRFYGVTNRKFIEGLIKIEEDCVIAMP